MATDAQRRELYVALERHLGRGPADTMMDLLPPVGWTDVARQRDVAALGTALGTEILALRAEVKGDIAQLRADVEGDIAELRTELKDDVGSLKAQLPKMYAVNLAAGLTIAGFILCAARLA